jgi:hypothetical protein
LESGHAISDCTFAPVEASWSIQTPIWQSGPKSQHLPAKFLAKSISSQQDSHRADIVIPADRDAGGRTGSERRGDREIILSLGMSERRI